MYETLIAPVLFPGKSMLRVLVQRLAYYWTKKGIDMNQTLSGERERFLLFILTFFLAVSAPFLPIFGAFFFLLWSAPAAVLYVRQGRGPGIAAMLTGAVVQGAILGAEYVAQSLFIVLSLAITMAEGIRQHRPGTVILVRGLLASVAGGIASLGFLQLVYGIAPFSMFLESAHGSMEMIQSALQPAASREGLAKLEEIVGYIAPSVLFFEAATALLLHYQFMRRLFYRLGMGEPMALPPFSTWKLPVWFFYLFGFSMVGLYWGGTREIDLLYRVSINGELIAMLAGLIEGFSLFWYIAERFSLSPIFRWSLVFFTILSAIMMQIVAFTGLFDTYFDYRRRFSDRRNS
ncbi:hypothetical protein TAMA11512_20140 [Selenomonas sp. TAMA-11512]|uniref:DUF2232 domain-containing protein n=1 Tax=Selenomonas sp. TAMA-11512 TaxID=3095337 RepID=UPI00308EB8F4|nr:hypothetical protein TAMA11512_20140 [Selenomonas sp. TAMA-11512]